MELEPANSPKPAERPGDVRELSLRAVIVGLIVAAIMGSAYPYVVLKLGFGPNVSVVAAFFGFIFLGLFSKTYNRWENNLVQTAGTAAAQTSFMCVLLAAFDMLVADGALPLAALPTPPQCFAWLTAAGLLGVLLAVPMRRHFVVDEKLPYPDGIAAAETVMVLDSRGREAGKATRILLIGAALSAGLAALTEDFLLVKLFAGVMAVGPQLVQAMGVGINWSLLSAGSGMLVGLRINTSMLLGTILAWVIAPYILLERGWVAEGKRAAVLFWVMWPATGMLVCGGLTGLLLRWKVLARTFANLRNAAVADDDFPLRWVAPGCLAAAAALVVLQKSFFGIAPWITVVAILLSVPLMLVGLRVLGETNWGPISALSNLMQGIFGALVPGSITVNMFASGTTGTIAADSEALMQDYKAGHIIGSSPRRLTYMQLMATPVGALAVSYMYPLLRETYGIVGDQAQLSSPTSRRWAGFAEILSKGFEALPPYALHALVAGAVLGVILTVLESGRSKKWVPSPTGLGIGMLVPGAVIITMFLGSVIETIWRKSSPKSCALYMTPLASGLIAGEAILAVIVPLLDVAGLLKK
ncbi:MAG TPA: OPT family oligopeptide transporter [Planctomycetota bacterium]|nr:OPT family oligopeptide transporter [Planctomycetota bacterium]